MSVPARSAPRLEDVARVAGVSHQTVSRVVNGSARVAPATRERVLEAVRELGYRRNSAARALATQKSGVIGVVVAGLGFFGPSSTVVGLELAARAEGYSMVLASLPEVTADATQAALDHLVGESVEAIVLIAPVDTGLDLGAGSTLPVPIVVLDADPTRSRLSVGVDHEAGARLATQHLVDLGHRRIDHLRGPLDWYQAHARTVGWRSTLEAAGLPVPEPLVGDWTASSGFEMGRLLAADPEVTAIFVANDQMSIGVLRALSEAGRRVPGDVSIVGFDDIPESEYFSPPLTTVRQNFEALGRGAMGLLTDAIRGDRQAGTVTVPPKLVVRASTARPPAGAGG
ncbi:LacI family DNA-binding transcriptional regulator [Nostocoides sp. HKS02]|uniref:LacI family DNA-binding transcriptional regulator n=1 Tax=Nostocoides sp. HKS02 TaxID=1813880 RepID=UPI0012B4623A|nr:LacI family DNA-binding transcriptional regulator [Tetrasphaera sp. HKS02]QGN58308.1 LacI family DNA-binding transcriptional regulator [Tetrasphaera sp. HKS02]